MLPNHTRPTLTDTGPIVAIIDPKDKNHARCWQTMQSLSYLGLVMPTACLVEALYLLGKSGGYSHQRKLWNMIEAGAVQLRTETTAECMQAGQLMDKFAGIPMDYADAIVVISADALDTNTIFTMDRHFYAYRRSNGTAFAVIPG